MEHFFNLASSSGGNPFCSSGRNYLLVETKLAQHCEAYDGACRERVDPMFELQMNMSKATPKDTSNWRTCPAIAAVCNRSSLTSVAQKADKEECELTLSSVSTEQRKILIPLAH
uniref:Uncharacterized protein n=1 Tax=Ascaris lumbricoides TaxID=6252 RepID=A0A0M3IAC7_ASCLU